jgi:uncharacterized membrane protein YeaQ/YmgE (transglycosylase-associated protein family)
MNFKMYIMGGIIYVVLAIILGMVGGAFAGYAILIAALIAGMYVGMKAATPMKGAIDGIFAGIIGGVIAGIIAPFLPMPMAATTGVTLMDSIVSMLGTTLTGYLPMIASFAWFIAAGIILGAIGGFIGKKIKK